LLARTRRKKPSWLDDRKENLDIAASLGFQTVLVADQPQNGYQSIRRLADLPNLF